MKRLLVLIFLTASAWGANCPTGYGYYKALTVGSGKVTGTLASFPALVLNPASTSGKLATVANGGRVTSSSGYDIVPATTAGSLLPFELVAGSYTASSGNLQMWVKVSSITDGTVINLCYGNSAITTYQGDDATTWAAFAGVLHSDDNAASTVVVNSLGTNNGASVANTSTKTATGKIGNALTYNGTTDVVDLGDPAALQFPVNATWSYGAWINLSSVGSEQDIAAWQNGINGNVCAFYNSPAEIFLYREAGSSAPVVSTTNPTTATWYHVYCTYDGTSGRVYINGANQATGTGIAGNLKGADLTGVKATIGASWDQSGGVFLHFFTGLLDEARMTGSVLSDAWIATEYVNQLIPGNDGTAGFWGIGTETLSSSVTVGASPTIIPTNNSGAIVLTLVGSGTSWGGTTVMTASGVSGTSCSAVVVTGSTAATVSCTTGSATGTLTITETVTGSASTTVAVGFSGTGGCAMVGVQ